MTLLLPLWCVALVTAPEAPQGQAAEPPAEAGSGSATTTAPGSASPDASPPENGEQGAVPPSAEAPAPTITPAASPNAQPTSPPPPIVRPDPRIDRLEQTITELQERIDTLESEALAPRPAPALELMGGVTLQFRGFADFGFFDARGDGAAYAADLGREDLPEGVAWAFTGDPWANSINTQGDSADLGLDRTNIPRVDPIASRGNPSFLINLVELGTRLSLGPKLSYEQTLDFEPRQGTLGALGDRFWVDQAFLDWTPFAGRDFHLFAGKFESTFGVEYRRRKAPDRFGITPSIIARYTNGTPVGLKARGSFARNIIIYNVALTNGGMSTERFGHMSDELDANGTPTGSARVSIAPPVPFELEVGGSLVYGAQDGTRDLRSDHLQWGADLTLRHQGFTLRGEFLRSFANRDNRGDRPSLDSTGFFTDVSYQFHPLVGALIRADWRKAELVTQPNLYTSNTGRLTAALRFDLTFNVIAKVEYIHIQEFKGPELDDDVVTSSLVVRF